MIRDEDEHYLMDSNIVSELFRYEANFNVLKKMVEHSSDMAISVITLDELLYGVALLNDGHKKRALTDFLQEDVRENFPIKLFTENAAEIHSKIHATMIKNGHPLPFGDTLIAAIALAEDMILVTRNTKHFEEIAKYFPLKLENWFES